MAKTCPGYCVTTYYVCDVAVAVGAAVAAIAYRNATAHCNWVLTNLTAT